MIQKGFFLFFGFWLFVGMAAAAGPAPAAGAGTLEEIRERGVLRHLGIPYAHFVYMGKNGVEGLDVELMRRFARHLGVAYEWVPTTWSEAFGDLTGTHVRPIGGAIRTRGTTPIKGDILANGVTRLPWRESIVDFSVPTFPTGVWLVARADSPIVPITPSGDVRTDIERARDLLDDRSILAMENTCLDPSLYRLEGTGVEVRLFTKSEDLGALVPAVMEGAADTTLLDIPDALVALQKWPGKIKIIGPISPPQWMGAVVPKTSPALLAEFNRFFHSCWADGAYRQMVERHFPAVFLYLGDFFDAHPPAE
jgi:ABC-type amino acid transport substrate-binding protein